jgi:hypothetical protein
MFSTNAIASSQNIFDLWLAEFMDAEPMDAEGKPV